MSMMKFYEFELLTKEQKAEFRKNAHNESEKYVKYGAYKTHLENYFSSFSSEYWGHTFDRHFNKSNAFLLDRLNKVSDKRVNSACTFIGFSEEELISLLKELLLEEETASEIATWMFAYPDMVEYTVVVPAGKVVGHGYSRNRRYQEFLRSDPVPCNMVCFVLKREFVTDGFIVKTAYPAFDGMGYTD